MLFLNVHILVNVPELFLNLPPKVVFLESVIVVGPWNLVFSSYADSVNRQRDTMISPATHSARARLTDLSCGVSQCLQTFPNQVLLWNLHKS